MADTQQPFAQIDSTLPTDAPVARQMNIPAAKNYAADPKVMDYCKSDLYGIVTRTKNRRRLLEDEWLAIQRLRTLTHDAGQKYKGRSNVYMPNYANAHGTLVSQLSRGLFPSDDYMDVEAIDLNGNDAAEQVKAAMKYELDCNAKLRAHIKPALSQLVDHGNMVLKYRYRTGNEYVGKKAKGGMASFEKKPAKGLSVSARSIFNVVVYPETAEDENDIIITAEYVDIDRNYALQMKASGRWLNVDEALATANTSDISQYSRDQSIIDQTKIPGMLEIVDPGDSREPTAQIATFIEIYVSIRLPDDAYVEGEDKSLPVPARIVMCRGIPVEVTRNMNYDQKHPYLWGRQGVVPGSFYGSWAGRRARYLQYLINDLANQTNDTGIMGLNPFMIVDTNLLTGPLLPYAPGRIFNTRDVKNAIAFQHPPMEPIQYGQQMVQMYAGALVDGVGAPPVLQGIGKSGETATGQSILQRNALSPLQDVVEDIEAQVMIPLLERAWRLIVQFTDRPIVITMPDGTQKPIEVADLDGFEYNFKFLSSSQAANQQARAQQSVQMLQILPTVNQQLMPTGRYADPAYVLKKLCADLGWRQFNQFVGQMPMMMQQQMAMQQQGDKENPSEDKAEGGKEEVAGESRGSEQNAPLPDGMNNDAAPQATDDFEAMRSIVDEINAMEGGKGLG